MKTIIEQLKVLVSALESSYNDYETSEEKIPRSSYKDIRITLKSIAMQAFSGRKAILEDFKKKYYSKKK